MENNINNQDAPQMQQGAQTTQVEQNGQQGTPTAPEQQGISTEDIVTSMLETSIANAVNNVQAPQQQTEVVDYGSQIAGITETLAGLTASIEAMRNNTPQTNNENNVDTPVQNATINSNDKPFDVEGVTNTVTNTLTEQLSSITKELNNMKVNGIKQAYSLNDSDYNFVSEVAQQVGIDILNDNAGLQSIINTIEKNNKVVIGEKRVESQLSETELEMQRTSERLQMLAGGKL